MKRQLRETAQVSRRKALKILLGAGVGAAGLRLSAAGETMMRRSIPRSGELVPAVGLGTWQTFDVGSSAAERGPLKEVLAKFVELGGAVVDTSPMYGAAETVIGDLMAELALHRALFVATKVWVDGREAGIRQMQRSMKRLRSDGLDLIQVHNLVDWQTHLPTLRRWRDEGKVRYIGVTHYTSSAYGELEQVMRAEELDFVQLNYSIAEREAEERLLPLAQERRIAVIANRPFAKASLFRKVRGKPLPLWANDIDCKTWAQFFLKFILSHPAVTCAIPATSKVKHLVDNMQAGYGRLPDAATRMKMMRFIDEI